MKTVIWFMPALFLSACFENLVQNTVEKAFDDIHEEVMSPVRIQKEWEEVSDVDEQAQIAKAVSYTHLTLPTNREV